MPSGGRAREVVEAEAAVETGKGTLAACTAEGGGRGEMEGEGGASVDVRGGRAGEGELNAELEGAIEEVRGGKDGRAE